MPADAILWAHYDDEHVVFHRASGLTHFVNEATAILILDVLTQPKTMEEIVRDVAAVQGATADEQFAIDVTALIQRLDELGLVERMGA